MTALISDLETGEVLAEISLDSIPFRAVVGGDGVWVTSDGPAEALTLIDAQALVAVEQFEVGVNTSNTTGPTRPLVVGDEVWVPNRGDDAIYAVATQPAVG